MENYVITISRLCGCGGAQVGQALSKKLGISYYDKKILRLASDDSGISEELFHAADEKLKNPLTRFFRKIYSGELIKPESTSFTSNDNLFNYQAKTLHDLAERESFVAVGRCADYVLRDRKYLVRVFLTADEKTLTAREMERYGMTEKEATEKWQRLNRERSEYYRYYTGQHWSHAGNYDICLNTTYLSYEEAADMIIHYMKVRFGEDFFNN